MVIYVGHGDPEQSMRLLWDAPVDGGARRGPKSSLSAAQIVATAVELADAGGIDAVSMRAVGERLGRTPMALYTYIPGKTELIELMWDRVLGESPTEYDTSDGWRPALRQLAHDQLDLYLRHSWLLDISGSRSTLGPNETQGVEVAASILVDQQLPGVEVIKCIWSVSRFVHGSARDMAEVRRAASATGVDEYTWWTQRSHWLDELVPDYADRFPQLTRLAGEGAFDGDPEATSYLEAESRATFDFGLERLLDGIEAHLSASRPAPARRR